MAAKEQPQRDVSVVSAIVVASLVSIDNPGTACYNHTRPGGARRQPTWKALCLPSRPLFLLCRLANPSDVRAAFSAKARGCSVAESVTGDL